MCNGKKITKEESMKTTSDITLSMFNYKKPTQCEIPETLYRSYSNYEFRSKHCKESFPILDSHNIQILVEMISKIENPVGIEVMAGKGWLSYWLKKNNIPIIATTDNYTWCDHFNFKKIAPGIDVVNLDAVETVKKYKKKANLVIMCWPYMDSFAYKVAVAMKGGDYLLYIGESYGGCTANDKFFDYINKRFKLIDGNYDFKRFFGIHDIPILYRKKKRGEK